MGWLSGLDITASEVGGGCFERRTVLLDFGIERAEPSVLDNLESQ